MQAQRILVWFVPTHAPTSLLCSQSDKSMLQNFKSYPKPPSITINETKADSMDDVIFEYEKQRRVAIDYALNNALNQPPKNLWKAAGYWIEDSLEAPKQNRTRLWHLLEWLIHDFTNDFSSERKKLKERNNNNMIPINSVKAQIVAYCIEGGGSIDQVHLLVMQFQLGRELDTSGRSSIRRLNPVKVVIKKGGKGV